MFLMKKQLIAVCQNTEKRAFQEFWNIRISTECWKMIFALIESFTEMNF